MSATHLAALLAWGPVAAVAVGACWVAATLGVRLLRHTVLARQARIIEILPPPEATLPSAEAFWSHTLGLLKPRWQRAFTQPHLAFEYVATAGGVHIQLWVPGTVPPGVAERAISAAWPGATTTTRPTPPAPAHAAVRTGGWMRLARGDEYPLRTGFSEDPLRALLGAMGGLRPGQSACVRISARPATGARLRRARTAAARIRGAAPAPLALLDPLTPGATTATGSTWPDAAGTVRTILTKAAAPRLACQVSYHLASTTTSADEAERLRGHAHALASSFAVFTSGTNHLRRRRMWAPAAWAGSRYLARGYLLSVAELAAIAHLPTDAAIPGLERAGARPIAPTPAIPRGGPDARVLGDADAGAPRPIAAGVSESRQHTHIIGATGKGKSTLLANLVLQDAAYRRAALVVDPRGDLVTDIIARLPEPAIGKVVLFDPDDNAPPPRLNLLQGDPDFTSDTVVGIFRRIYDQWWGPRTDDILRAATLTLTRTGDASLTLGEIPRLLADDAFRARLLTRIADDALRDFWTWYEALSPGGRTAATGPVLNKLRTALLRPWVRQVIASGPSTIDLTRTFDSGGLVLMRLPKGRLGEDTSSLIGSFALAATWQAVLSRITVPERLRPDTAAFIDEAHNFLNLPGSLSDMFAEARGYHLSLILAHQERGQFPAELRKALSANARSKIYFAISPDDAADLAQHTHPSLSGYDLTHLGDFQAAARLLVGGRERPAFTMRTRPLPPVIPGRATEVRKAARTHTPTAPAPSAPVTDVRARP
ncbi:type IV secretory system conjugative DNA transfer family protein [Murinocardiopsis flavida]|uniref:type IV secretory system conjugative DNA transfer family protein n=1 Tax=Murinocardiopsis flavida TaxID=645275 RepID=UPI000D0D7351|nr:type IV secretion system DNA-binding domain-containing protein [Murinocardiopsis flavida]